MAKKNLNAADELEFLNVDSMDDNSQMNTNNNFSGGGIGGGVENDTQIGAWFFKQSKHPMVAFFHLLFKSLALFMYIFGGYFTSNFIIIFVLVIILLAFDFWVVKNLSGRLLVGLRWWSTIKEDGQTDFIFESLQDMSDVTALDTRIFWWGMYGAMAMWGLCLFIGVLRLNFQYVPIILAAMSMTGANMWGYMKCSADSQAKLKMFQDGMSAAANRTLDSSGMMMGMLTNAVMGMASNGTSAGGNGRGGGGGRSRQVEV